MPTTLAAEASKFELHDVAESTTHLALSPLRTFTPENCVVTEEPTYATVRSGETTTLGGSDGGGIGGGGTAGAGAGSGGRWGRGGGGEG